MQPINFSGIALLAFAFSYINPKISDETNGITDSFPHFTFKTLDGEAF